MGGVKRAVYLPLDDAVNSSIKKETVIRLVPTAELTEVFTTVSELDGNLKSTNILLKSRKEPGNYYPPKTPFDITLPHDLPSGQIYLVVVSATMNPEGSTIVRLLVQK
ncbi:hypothetical protein NTG1052_20001 [Candidatus Nitrotoga sp. 1052]|nr:hypothetical protein NTG1052_20001 [Candidatus Nitrotoga sp. 1052]